ncbi:unnamed protein product, partial [marine sediment metagenome]
INSDGNAAAAGAGAIQVDTWHHVAAVFDESDGAAPMKIYVDGILKGTAAHSARVGDSPRSFGIGCIIRDNSNPPGNSGQFFNGRIDEVRISDKALGPSEFLHTGFAKMASNPSPSDGAINVAPDANLSWTPGPLAVRHDVYLSTDFNDVNDATDPNTLPGRGRWDVNSYNPPNDFDLNKTYYWRIDEVGESTFVKGDVWRFTAAEPYINSLGMEFVYIASGTFTMGSENGDFDEEPVHNVTISQPFYMSAFEVTNAQ